MVLLYCDVSLVPSRRYLYYPCYSTTKLTIFRLLLFLVFFPRMPTLPETITTDKRPTWRLAVTVAILCLLHGLAVIIVSAALAISRPHHLGLWANILGIMATILSAIQYLPQIWTTYSLGHVGSLSIPMMLIQTPGSFVWAASLAARLGVEGWSTWGVYLVTGCLQGCLLALGISFELKARRERQAVEEVVVPGQPHHLDANYVETDDEGGPIVENGQTERTPLLNGALKTPAAN